MSLFCGRKCQKRKDKRLELRFEFKNHKLDERTDRVELRQAARTVAYQNGIDPNASWTGMIGSLGQSAASVFQAKFAGPGLSPQAKYDQAKETAFNPKTGGSMGGISPTMMMVGGGLLLVVVMMMGKRN